ncbi:hypothetical protein Pfo_011455 [Paulownia fortunei]|nr:hypothetical protein Pfo_011455 [Paulownia fortunei]
MFMKRKIWINLQVKCKNCIIWKRFLMKVMMKIMVMKEWSKKCILLWMKEIKRNKYKNLPSTNRPALAKVCKRVPRKTSPEKFLSKKAIVGLFKFVQFPCSSAP